MRAVWSLGLGLLVVGAPAVAWADASVVVRLTDSAGRPIDGTVTLRAGATTRTCRTTAGRCTISAPAGSYTATVAPTRGGAPPPRTLRVPAAGSVTLAMTTPGSSSGGTSSSGGGGSMPALVGTAGSGSIVAGAVGSTGGSGTSGAGTSGTGSPPSGGAPAAGGTSGTPPSAGATLSSGSRLVCQGTVMDSAGRPADATITVRRGSTTLGTVRTTAGRFSIYDLSAGSYSLSASGPRGSGSATLSVGSGISRTTLRLR